MDQQCYVTLDVHFSPMFTWGLVLSKTAAYVLAPNLSWLKTWYTGFAPRQLDRPVREVLNTEVTDLAKGIVTAGRRKKEKKE